VLDEFVTDAKERWIPFSMQEAEALEEADEDGASACAAVAATTDPDHMLPMTKFNPCKARMRDVPLPLTTRIKKPTRILTHNVLPKLIEYGEQTHSLMIKALLVFEADVGNFNAMLPAAWPCMTALLASIRTCLGAIHVKPGPEHFIALKSAAGNWTNRTESPDADVVLALKGNPWYRERCEYSITNLSGLENAIGMQHSNLAALEKLYLWMFHCPVRVCFESKSFVF